MLAHAESRDQLDAGTVAEVLRAVSRQNWYTLFNLNTYTVYSDYFDLEERTAWIWYLSNFEEVVRIDLDEELALGAHHVLLTDLFSGTTVQKALEEFNSAGLVGSVAMFGIIAVLALGVITAVGLSVRWLVRRRRRARGEAGEATGGEETLGEQG